MSTMGYSRRFALGLALLAALQLPACGPQPRPAVTLSFKRVGKTPADASVYIDEELIGPLAYVAARGVRLPEGEHRITIERSGYFPWDRIVVSDREPIFLQVELQKIPD
jgi:hypothetical protein